MFLAFTFELKGFSRQNSHRCQRKLSIHKEPFISKLHIIAALRLSVHLLNVKTQLYLIKTN